MRPPEQVIRDFVRQWLDKAEEDLRAGEILLDSDLEDFDSVGFHAQQAAEKFIKAVLVRHQIPFPKSHSIQLLRGLVAQADKALAEKLSPADSLTPYGVEFRYPGESEPVSWEQGAETVQIAGQIRKEILVYLEEYLSPPKLDR